MFIVRFGRLTLMSVEPLAVLADLRGDESADVVLPLPQWTRRCRVRCGVEVAKGT